MIYTLRQIRPNVVEIAGFDDHDIPESTYVITGVRCSCPGSYRSPHCKHRQIQDAIGADIVGVFYDPDTGQRYKMPFDLIDEQGNLTEILDAT